MSTKKATIKAGKAAPKSVEKNEESEKQKVSLDSGVQKKIQTAEGWKRSMKKARGK